jgi:hypothetical protein
VRRDLIQYFANQRFPREQILTIAELLPGQQALYPHYAPTATGRAGQPPAAGRGSAAGGAVRGCDAGRECVPSARASAGAVPKTASPLGHGRAPWCTWYTR